MDWARSIIIGFTATWFLATTISAARTSEAAAAEYGPYRGRIVRVVDGDTVEAEVNIWPQQQWRGLVRLRGINAPELRSTAMCESVAARAAADALRYHEGQPAEFRSVGADKFGGRVDATIVSAGVDIGEEQITLGHARPYTGGRRLPWCTQKP